VTISPPYAKAGWPPRRRSLLALALAAAFAVLGLGVGVSPAAAKTPCWKKVVQDWYADGRIDGSYSTSCLSEARSRLPEDVRVYSSFDDQVRRERQEIARRPASAGASARSRSRGPQLGDEPRRGLFKVALDKTSPRNADSMPLPLLILAGMALLLIAAGAAGLASRRIRARRARPG
jgi:hypothetical protein